MTMVDGTILRWWVRTWLFVVVLFTVLSLPSVTPLEDFYGACSRVCVLLRRYQCGVGVAVRSVWGGRKPLHQMDYM